MRILEIRKCWENYSKVNLVEHLRNYSLVQLNNLDICLRTKELSSILTNIMSKLTYDKLVETKLINKWYDRELTELNKLKFELFKTAERSNDWCEYHLLKRHYKKMVKLKKAQYMESKIFMNSYNQKLMWKCLKDTVNMTTNTTKIKKVVLNGVWIEDENEIANELNKYFVESIMSIHNSIENIVMNEEREVLDRNTFEFRKVTTDDIIKTVSSLKNKHGGKKMLTEGVIKDSMEYLGYTYACLINESFSQGIFPECWKISVVIPVEKIRGTTKPEELRPINTLQCDEKIIETIAKDQLLQYLDDHQIIIQEQSGFRSKHSCESAINLVITEWKENLSKKEITISVFLDLKRAFETVDRENLIKKLHNVGVQNQSLNWFESYLSGRRQKTVIGDAVSSEIDVPIGLQQGSVLAPILFIVYINDVIKYLKFCKIRLFADDALLTLSAPTMEEAISKVQADLNMIYIWLCHNKLKINIDKTKYMLMTRRTVDPDIITLNIANNPLQRVDKIKYLGIIIDDKLKFDEHLKYTEAKLGKKIGIMLRTCKFISKKYKIMVYRSMIEPHFIYCPTILFTFTDTQISNLQKKQNKAMRFILRKRYDTPILEMLRELNWLSVKQLVTYYTLKFIHNIKLGNLPGYLSNRMIYNSEIHNYQTRNRNNFHVPIARNELDRRSLYCRGVRAYNELPVHLKNCESPEIFKKLLYEYSKLSIAFR